MRSVHESRGVRGARERLLEVGAASLSDTELIAILLGTGTAAAPVAVLAATLLESAGGVAGLAECGVGALANHPGIGIGKATRIIAALELGKRLQHQPLPPLRPLCSSREVFAAMRPHLSHLAREELWALPLDGKLRHIGQLTLAVGSLNACAIAPADVFRALLKQAASSFILVHNHPSGDVEPSPEDIAFTRSLYAAGELLHMRLVDHVIVASQAYYSFLDQGLLPPPEQETKEIDLLRSSQPAIARFG